VEGEGHTLDAGAQAWDLPATLPGARAGA